MAAETTYFVANYDTEASGPFVALSTNLLTWSGGTGFIVSLIDNGTTGKLHVALVSGVAPTNAQVLTQSTTTANCVGPAANGDSEPLLYPAFFRNDIALAANGVASWTGPALGATHSFLFDGQTSNVVVGEILTFSPGGQQCEVVTVVSDVGASGELAVRWISFLDTLEFPDDNDTFTGDIAGDGVLNMVVHPRCYSPLNAHRLLADLNDDSDYAGDDVWSSYNATPSARSTDQIAELKAGVVFDDTIVSHMFGGSIDQLGGATQYSGVDIQITDSDGGTNPVVIQNDAIVTAYWGNAYMPDSIAGRVRIMRKTRSDGVNVDGKRIKAKLLRYGDLYFEGSTTLGQATTGLALFSAPDGNNATAVGTVAGAPYNTITITEGFQLLDFNNGNGATPFTDKLDFGSATSPQAYERTKYIQRRGTAETLNGRNAQLYTGVTLNLAYDAEAGGPFTQDEQIVWGTRLPFTGGSGAFTVGEVVTGGTSGARGRVLYQDFAAGTGKLRVATDTGSVGFNNTETITGVTSGETATTGTVVNNTRAGTAILMGLDDQGAAGNLYLQLTRGLAPNDNQQLLGASSGATADADAATSLQTRVINTQAIGSYTGTAYNPANFGWAIDPTDAIASDLFTNLLGATQQPPNNQIGAVTSGVAGDKVWVYAWDGSTLDANGDPEPDFNEMTLATTLAGGEGSVVVNAIPGNTPQVGNIRLQRDSDGQYDLIPYSSHDGIDTFTLTGTAPSAATSGNFCFRAPIDKVWSTTGVPETFTAVYSGTPNSWAVGVMRGGVNPIKPFRGSASFGATGFIAAAQRISDS